MSDANFGIVVVVLHVNVPPFKVTVTSIGEVPSVVAKSQPTDLAVKVAAITVFLVIGVVVAMGFWPGVPGGVANLTSHGGFMPTGFVPVLTGAVAATGFYFGSEIVTVAAAESAEPGSAAQLGRETGRAFHQVAIVLRY